MGKEEVRAFLIGAGATKAQYSESPLSSDFFKILERYSNRGLKEVVVGINRILHSLGISNSLRSFSLEELMIEVQNRASNSQATLRAFQGYLYTAIYYLIGMKTGSTIIEIRDYLNGNRTPTLFHLLLTDPRCNEHDFFMNLNYDLYLDRVILRVRRGKIDYGLQRANCRIERYSLPKVGYVDIDNSLIYSVYHLHGALNWELDKNNQLVIHLLNAIPPQPERNKVGSTVLITPPGKKILGDDYNLLQSVWNVARSRLLNKATELIIIGSSLNEQDEELVNLVRKFIDKNGIENVKIIYGGNKKQRNHYINILGKGFKEYDKGFEEKAIDFIFG